MTPTLPTDPLDRAFRELPREHASDGFTRKVVTGLESRRQVGHRARRQLRWALAAASVSLLVLVGALALEEHQRQRSLRAFAQRAEKLRQEQRLLHEELAALRRVVDEHQPVVYLGGNDRVDLVYDLAPVAARTAALQVQPAVVQKFH